MGTNYYLKFVQHSEEEKIQDDLPIHVGKQSGGWTFLWDLSLFQVWKRAKDPRWALVSEYFERTKQNIQQTVHLTPDEVIPGVTEEDVLSILMDDNYLLVAECGGIADLDYVLSAQKDQRNKMTDFLNQKKNGPAFLGMYTRGFIIGSFHFSPSTNFS